MVHYYFIFKNQEMQQNNIIKLIHAICVDSYSRGENPLELIRSTGTSTHFEYLNSTNDFFLTNNSIEVIQEQIGQVELVVLLDNSGEKPHVVIHSGITRYDGTGEPTLTHAGDLMVEKMFGNKPR